MSATLATAEEVAALQREVAFLRDKLNALCNGRRIDYCRAPPTGAIITSLDDLEPVPDAIAMRLVPSLTHSTHRPARYFRVDRHGLGGVPYPMCLPDEAE